MPPTGHAILSASAAHRWLCCPPSARLAEKLTEKFGSQESPFAIEGTKAHALAEAKVRYAIWQADKMTAAKHGKLAKAEREAYAGINKTLYNAQVSELGEIPKDMEQATDTYMDVVMSKYHTAKEEDPAAQILLEQRLDFSKWVPSGFGTGDCVIVSDNLLEVVDYKHGKGVPVAAEQNPQLRLYALGAFRKFASLYDFKSVRYTIVQPRLNSVSAETISVAELLTWAEFEVVPRAKQAWEGTGEFCAGEHCRFCPAKAVCSKRVGEALKAFAYGFEEPGLLPDDMLPGILQTLDVAEAWIKDVREYANKQALSGNRIPGWKLVRGKRPNRVFIDKDEVKAQLLRSGFHPDQFEQTALKPVGEIEKLLGKKAFNALLSELVSQGEGKPVLVPESDARAEISSADSAFADLCESNH